MNIKVFKPTALPIETIFLQIEPTETLDALCIRLTIDVRGCRRMYHHTVMHNGELTQYLGIDIDSEEMEHVRADPA